MARLILSWWTMFLQLSGTCISRSVEDNMKQLREAQTMVSDIFRLFKLPFRWVQVSRIWAASSENRIIAYAKTKAQISCTVTAQLISVFVFATWIAQFLFYYIPKFQASSLLLWLYRPVCVRPGRNLQKSVFSCRSSCFQHFRVLDCHNFSVILLKILNKLIIEARPCSIYNKSMKEDMYKK